MLTNSVTLKKKPKNYLSSNPVVVVSSNSEYKTAAHLLCFLSLAQQPGREGTFLLSAVVRGSLRAVQGYLLFLASERNGSSSRACRTVSGIPPSLGFVKRPALFSEAHVWRCWRKGMKYPLHCRRYLKERSSVLIGC